MDNTGAVWEFRCARPLAAGKRPLVMGIVNMTPDSFSGLNAADGERAAVSMALGMLSSGADMVDIGAESSRPGARVLEWEEEVRRLGEVVARLRGETGAPISVDTYHPETAGVVLGQGADIINDIAALRGGWDEGDLRNEAMGRVVAEAGAHVVLMHMPASPTEMQESPEYGDVVGEVRDFLGERVAFAEGLGVERGKIWLDPGFGFGKSFDHNRELLLRLGEIVGLGFPVLAGLSRKRMVGEVLGVGVEGRLEGSVALAVMAAMGGAEVIRVHDVAETYRAVAMVGAVRNGL